MAIGGCRKCARTFNSRLELIQHFVDHFPAIFYSFEAPQQSNEQIVDPTFFAQLSEILAAKPKVHKAIPPVKSKPKESSSLLPYHMCSTCCLTFSELNTYEEHLQLHSTKVRPKRVIHLNYY